MNYIRKIFKSKLAQNGMWLILLQGFNTVVPIITLPYITRILSAAGYGEFALSLNWIGYFQVIVEFGFGLTGARKVAMCKHDDELPKIRSSIIYARMLLLIVCAIVFFIVVFATKVSETQIVCMLILFLMVIAIVFQQTWFFQGISEMKNITIINASSRTISVALIFFLVKSVDHLYLYCFLYTVNYLIASVVGCFIVNKKYQVKVCKVDIKDVIKEIQEGWSLFVSCGMSKIFGSIGITILGVIATKADVGIYSAINKIPYVMTLLFAAIGQALYPQSCKAFAVSFNNGQRSVKKYGVSVLAFFTVCGLGIIALNRPIVRVALGSEYEAQSLLLIPFVIWALTGIVNNFLGVQTVVASGHQKEYSQSFTVSVVIMLGLMFLLGKMWQSYGIAIASMISEMSLSVLLLYNIRKIKRSQVLNQGTNQ